MRILKSLNLKNPNSDRKIHAISLIQEGPVPATDQLLAKTELVARLNEEIKKYKLLISPEEDELWEL